MRRPSHTPSACAPGPRRSDVISAIPCITIALVLSSLCVESASAALTLTPAAAARGFAISTYASGFPSATAIGPLGIAFRGPATVLVTDNPNGQIFVLPTHADGQVAAATLATSYGGLNAKGIAQIPDTTGPYFSRYYMTQQFLGGGKVVEIDPATGATIRVVANIAGATGICAYPSTGDPSSPLYGKLLVSNPEITGLYVVDPAVTDATPTTPYISDKADGMCFSPDGSQLVIASGGVRVYSLSPTPTLVASSGDPATSDGITVGLGALAGFAYVNVNDGNVFEYGLPGGPSPGSLTAIATGGSRGDFVAIDPVYSCGADTTFPSMLLTQSNDIVRLCFDGPVAGGFFGPPASSIVPPPGPGFPIDPPVAGPRKRFDLIEPPEFTAYDLQTRVRSGYVVLKESAAVADSDSTNWSDVVAFTSPPNKPAAALGNAADHAYLVSDVGEGIQDTLLAQIPHLAGNPITCRDIRRFLALGRALAIPEVRPPTVYLAGANTYRIFSDIDAPYDSTHYWSYSLLQPKDTLITVTAHDQFVTKTVDIDTLERLVNWVRKNNSYVRDTTLHFAWWNIRNKEPVTYAARIANQFGVHTVHSTRLEFMLVPALKNRPEDPAHDVSHYLCYKAFGFHSPGLYYDLEDEWRHDYLYVDSLEYLCVPCLKQHNGYDYEPADTVTHLAVYGIHPASEVFYPFVEDQFDSAYRYVEQRAPKEYLFVPSLKDSARVVAVDPISPAGDVSLAAAPNPMRGRGELEYRVAVPGDVAIEIFGVDGRRIRTLRSGFATPGLYRAKWTGTDNRGARVSSGVYLVRLRTSGAVLVRRIVFIR